MKRKKFSYVLMFAHFFNDINQGSLPAILPFLIFHQNLSYALAANLLFVSNLVSSLTQPLLGYFGDRTSKPWLMSLGIFFSGLGIALLGICSSYPLMLFSVGLSGFGGALFHPEGGKLANFVAGSKKGAGIGLFGVGGNLGFAVGPLMATAALYLFSLKGTLLFLIPTIIMPLILLKYNPIFKVFTKRNKKQVSTSKKKDDWFNFTKLTFIIFGQSIIKFALLVFIPLIFMTFFSFSEAKANLNLTLFALVGAIATLLGGKYADKYGFSKTIKYSAFVFVFVFALFLQTKIALLATLLIIPVSFFMNSSYSSLITLSQSCVPNHVGFASGISLGLAISVGGLFSPIIGHIADIKGISYAMYVVLAIAFLTAILSLFVNEKTKKGQK